MITLMLSLAFSSFAAAAPVICPSSNVFYSKIYNCGMNKLAPQYGRSCADMVVAESKVNGKKLSDLMENMKQQLGDAQTANMSEARKRLRMAVTDLERQIKSMQSNTNVVASYAEAMIDFPDSDSDDTSPDCFNENFHALQNIVNELDREIVNSKRARTEALRLLGSLSKSGSEMSNISGVKRKLSSQAVDALPKAPRAKRSRSSDISGTEEPKPKSAIAK
jgi:hypothetical protein